VSLERVFAAVDDVRGAASVDAAFGEPQQLEGKVLIPVAATGTGFGIGFQGDLSSTDFEDEEASPQVGGGGRGGARPVAVIEVTPEATVVRPIVDETRVFMAAIALVGWVLFWVTATVRSVFSGHHRSTARGASDLSVERQ
jgi:uncharacterized spore protein YtfJ